MIKKMRVFVVKASHWFALPETHIGRTLWLLSGLISIWIAVFNPFALDSRAEIAAEAAIQALGLRNVDTIDDKVTILQTTREGFRDGWYDRERFVDYNTQSILVDILVEARAKLIFIDTEYLYEPSTSVERTNFQLFLTSIRRARQLNIKVVTGPIQNRTILSKLHSITYNSMLSWIGDHPSDYQLRGENFQSAAAMIYLLLCANSNREQAECSPALWSRLKAKDAPPIATRFAFGFPKGQERYSGLDEKRRCSAGLLKRIRAQMLGRLTEAPCPQALTIPVEVLLSSGGHPSVMQDIRGRIVLIGTGPGLGDDHLIPGVGKVPGVSFHATALRNLFFYGPSYPRWPPELTQNLGIGLDDLLKIMTVFILPGLIAGAIQRLRTSKFNDQNVALILLFSIFISILIFILFAIVACALLSWPISIALNVGVLSAVVLQVLVGPDLQRALAPLTTRRIANMLVFTALYLMLAVLWPTVAFGLLIVFTAFIFIYVLLKFVVPRVNQ